ncbi:hypothetical protein EST38_g14490, partial [Candolleomyces aberdarensis]
MAEVPPKIKV